MDEVDFASLAPDQVQLGSSRRLGLWAWMVTLMQLFKPIMELNWRIVERTIGHTDLEKEVKRIEGQLQG